MEKSIEEQVKSRIYDAKNCTSYEEEFRSLIKQNNDRIKEVNELKREYEDLVLEIKIRGKI